jgi:hypothetical protein
MHLITVNRLDQPAISHSVPINIINLNYLLIHINRVAFVSIINNNHVCTYKYKLFNKSVSYYILYSLEWEKNNKQNQREKNKILFATYIVIHVPLRNHLRVTRPSLAVVNILYQRDIPPTIAIWFHHLVQHIRSCILNQFDEQ